MMKRNVVGQIILSVFVALPLVLFFQNCGGSSASGASGGGAGVGQDNSANPVKLSGSLVAGGGVNAEQFQLTSDGSRIVFIADREVQGRLELYSVQRDGSELIKLSGGGNVDSFQLVGDTQAVYLGEELAGQSGLYGVNLDASNRRSLSGSIAAGGNVLDYKISVDQQTVVFRADKVMVGTPELWACNLSGLATVVRLHAPAGAGQSVDSYQVVGSNVILRGSLASAGQPELFTVGLDASGFLKISAPLPSAAIGVAKFQSDATGSVIVYLADLNTAGLDELFLTSLTGTGKTQLNQAPVFGGQVRDFQLTAQGESVVYLGDLDVYGRAELYTRDVVGLTPPFKLNQNLASGGNVMSFSTFTSLSIVANAPVLTPGVSFMADADTDDQFELFISSDLSAIAGKINGALVPGGDVLQSAVSGDGSQAIYIADQNQSGLFELFSKSLSAGAGPAAALVEPDPDKDGVVPPFGFTPDNSRVLFVADLQNHMQRDLWAIGASGTGLKRLSHAHAAVSGIAAFKFSADGRWVAFVGDQDTTDVNELFIVPAP